MSKEQLNEKAEGIVDRFLASEFVAKVKVIALTVKDLVLIFVPFGIATYILHTQADKVVVALGVAIALIGFANTVKLAYAYENRSRKKR